MVHDVKVFVKLHKKEEILNSIIVCICYIHMAFSMNVGIDTEVMIVDGPRILGQWVKLGRQGLFMTKFLLKLSQYNPYFEGIIFLAAFILLGSSVAFFCWLTSGKDDRYPYGVFMLFFSTCPVWMPQFYFALQRAEVVLGMFYAVISVLSMIQVLFFEKKKIIWILSYLVFGVWSFCTYQGCVIFYIGLCIMFFLIDFVKDDGQKQWDQYLKIIFKLAGGFLLVFLINTAATQLFFGQAQYLQDQVGWGRLTFSQIFSNVCRHLKNLLFCRGMENRSVYPLACLGIALVWIYFLWKPGIKKSVKFIFFLALAGLLGTPFLLTFYLENIPVIRSQFAVQLIAAFACMFVCGVWRRERKQEYLWIERGITIIGIVVVWFSASTILRLQYTDDVRYQEDVSVAYRIAEDIQRTEGAEELPVIFIGRYTSRLNNATRLSETYGASLLGWDYSKEHPSGATGRIEGFMKTLGIDISVTTQHQQKAIKLAKNMECYPKPGYISVQDKFVVVKLSEID